jgi:hypothetical protein
VFFVYCVYRFRFSPRQHHFSGLAAERRRVATISRFIGFRLSTKSKGYITLQLPHSVTSIKSIAEKTVCVM